MHSFEKIKYRFAAMTGYVIPFASAAFVALFTKGGGDEENCVFAFFVGIVIQFIIGICGLIRLRGQEGRKKERPLFWGNLFPMVLLLLLFLASRTFRG